MENLDSLLELLRKSEEESSKPSLDESPSSIKLFITDNNITVGKIKYPTYVIFYLYRRIWDGMARQNKLTRQSFFKHFGKVFNAKRSKRQRYYLLNEFIELTETLITEAKNYDEIYRKKQATESKKRKPKKG